VEAANGNVRLIANDGNAALPALIGIATAQGARISDVSIQEPNLEAVFLHLTGRALRN
jgi:ABC-2 type transport system ATP-binding protein